MSTPHPDPPTISDGEAPLNDPHHASDNLSNTGDQRQEEGQAEGEVPDDGFLESRNLLFVRDRQ